MAFGSMLQHDEARRTGRALAHGQQAVHAGFGQILLVQHGALETGIGGQLLRFFGQQGGREQVGRRVVQTAGQAHGLGRAFAHPVQSGGDVLTGVEDDVVWGDLPQRHFAEGAGRPQEGPGGSGVHGAKPKWSIRHVRDA